MTFTRKKALNKGEPEANPQQPVAESQPPLDSDDVDALAAQAPEVTQSVVDLENSKAAEAEAQTRAQAAVSDTFRAQGFNPAIHEVDETGKPVLTPTGRFKMMRKSKRDGSEKQPRGTSTLGGVPNGDAGAGAQNMVNAQTAATVTILKETALTVLVSDEFLMSPQEKATETMLLTAALNHSYPAGVPVNPWLAYSAAVVTHAAARMGQPKTQSWLGRQKLRLAALYIRMKGRKYAAHTGNRPDNVGKNDTGSQENQPPAGATQS